MKIFYSIYNQLLYKNRIFYTFLLWIVIVSLSSASKNQQVKLFYKITVIVNTEKIIEVPIYKIHKQQYILLQDLAKIFYATLTYYSSSGYISFNYRGEKLYFYLGRNYFIHRNKRIYLSSEIMFVKNRTYIPLSIFFLPEFSSILNAEIQLKKEQDILIVNFVDNIWLDYYVTIDYAKIHFSFKQYVHYEYFYDDRAINITFFGGRISPKEYNILSGIVSKISLKPHNGNVTARIHLTDLNVKISKQEFKEKLVLEIEKTKELVYAKNEGLTEVYTSSSYLATSNYENVVVSSNTNLPQENVFINKKQIIVIDPGHGGEDPGAIGPNGTKEKDINLAIAKYLRDMLINDGYEVYLTREEDIFIPLVERTKFANDKNADIFISIHCNAAEKPRGDVRGFEIYFLSETATDPDAVATEKLENEVVKFEKKTPELEKLQKLLWSMVVNEFMNESSKLCSLITKEVIERTQFVNRGVKQAGFYVLRGAQMPAVLVECGFISHPVEEIKLNKKEIQIAIANGIYAGIKNYVSQKQNK